MHACNFQLPCQPVTSLLQQRWKWKHCRNGKSDSFISVPFNKKRTHTQLSKLAEQLLTEMSKSSSVSSNIRTLTVTCRPGGMTGGLWPGSNVLMPRVSGAPRRWPAPADKVSGSGSAMVLWDVHCKACIEAKTNRQLVSISTMCCS